MACATGRTYVVRVLDWPGRWANRILTVTNACRYAEAAGYTRVEFPPDTTLVGSTIAVTPQTSPAPNAPATVARPGLHFYDLDPAHLPPVVAARLRPRRAVAQAYVVPLLAPGLAPCRADEYLPADTLVAHLRSGDIWSTFIHPVYFQPPLHFYTDAVARASPARVVLVTSPDRANVCYAPFRAYLEARGIPYKEQASGRFEDDLKVLLRARTLVWGTTTIRLAVGVLGAAAETQYCTDSSDHMLPEVGRVVLLPTSDAYRTAVRAGWTNSPEQRRLLLSDQNGNNTPAPRAAIG